MKKPSFQFYPGDWRKDQNLSRASLQAKGALIEVMCLAFECEKRGVLKTGKHSWTIEEIAHAIGGDKMANISAIEELLSLKVLKKNRKQTVFSARMVRDEKLSKIRRAVGFKGGNPNLLNQTSNQKPTPSSSSSSSTSVREGENTHQKSKLFREPTIPTKQQVLELFTNQGGTAEMAKAFWGKHSATGWYLNGSPIVNASSLVGNFITNWNNNLKTNTKETHNSAPPIKSIYELP